MILSLWMYRLLSVLLCVLSVVESNENEMEVVGGSVFESREWSGEDV